MVFYTYGTSFITDGEKQPLIGVNGKSLYSLTSVMLIPSNFILSEIYLLLDVFLTSDERGCCKKLCSNLLLLMHMLS